MNESIAHLTLPGLGSVCAECFSRGHIAPFPLIPAETYSFGITRPPAELSWNVVAARALIAVRSRAARRLDPGWLERWLLERSELTPEHLDHIPSDKLDEPGIVVEIVACPPGGEPEPFRILIDGTYRAARRLGNGQDFWAYLLTEDEQRAICTYRRGGLLAELPCFPGFGITDQEAGISLPRPASQKLPEFDIGLLTVRSGSRIVRVTAADVAAARGLIQGECDTGQCHCPPEWCTDEVEPPSFR